MRWRKVEPSSSLRRFEAIAFLPRRQTLHRSRCWMVTWVWRHVANMQARRVSSSSNKLFEHITSTICNWQRFIWINTELNVDDKWRRPTDPAECVIHSRAAFECALADFVARFFFDLVGNYRVWFFDELIDVYLEPDFFVRLKQLILRLQQRHQYLSPGLTVRPRIANTVLCYRLAVFENWL